MLPIKFMSISCKSEFSWMPQNSFDDKLDQVMAWCRQQQDIT